MADRPILFRDDMVRAILDGRKTVTRRVGKTWAKVQPGDVLWVRETWRWFEVYDEDTVHVQYSDSNGVVVACGTEQETGYDWQLRNEQNAGKWRPSIHMPRWACRLTLRVVSVECENVGSPFPAFPLLDDDEARREGFAAAYQFTDLWCAMHPDYSGAVWRVAFEVVR